MRSAMLLTSAVALSALPFLGSGCVQQDRYDSLLTANRSLKEQLVNAEDSLATQEANVAQIRSELVTARSQNNSMQTQIGGLRGDLDDQYEQQKQLMQRVSSLQLGPLPFDVEQALDNLAKQHPDVLSFDAGLGMLQFSSDFTFGLGSVALKTEAKETLALVASILNSDVASNFEVQVVGHTDNVPIRNVGTRANHPTNLHLSVHRAISVRDALMAEGIVPARIQVAGYGEHRPITANRVGGSAQNRRVELYIVPLKTAVAGIAPVRSAAQEQQVTAPLEPMK
ncbi:MAG: OmpA family protein [Planctomycetota bacterium]|nr:OmpA family protein [Planctomycetota bacterium]